MTNPRILVTGASGKTGSHVVAVLLKAGYYIDDHKLGAFELAAPTSDVLDVTGRPAEDFETIARRCAAQPANQRTLGDWSASSCWPRSALASISTGTTVNCDGHCPRSRGWRLNPRSSIEKQQTAGNR